MRVLITGGAGFVGSRLALEFSERGDDVITFDNLRRRGSEINLETYRHRGIEFLHGDVRVPADFDELPSTVDVFIDAAAEPSVHAGGSSPSGLLDLNLGGTQNSLEWARGRVGRFVFLSTSRVYSIEALRSLPLVEGPTRLDLDVEVDGANALGIREDFSRSGARSFYGTSKLASELLVEEYAGFGGVPAVIDRLGVVAGPGQFGKVDQGVFTLWLARHVFDGELAYMGFGGHGHQVRDLLHPADLFDLLARQIDGPDPTGEIYNAGGGRAGSVSLLEWTRLAQEIAGREIRVASRPETTSVDVPWYVSNNAKVHEAYGWEPVHDARSIAEDTVRWIEENRAILEPILSPETRSSALPPPATAR